MRALWAVLFTFIFMALSPCLQAIAPKVVLLTSLDPDTNRPALRSKNWDINQKLEERFNRYLKRYNIDLEPVIIHFADQVSLYKTLTSEDVRAVIWVSHAGFRGRQGLVKATSIVDYNGRDLKGVFQALGRSVKFLGLVGCQGQGFIDDWKAKGWPESAHPLKTFSREKRTDARKGLRMAMKSLGENFSSNRSRYLENQDENIPISKNSREVSIEVKRLNKRSVEMKSVQVYQRKRLIAVLSPSLTDQETVIKIQVKANSKKSDLKIILDSGENSLSENPNLGVLEFSPTYRNHWNLFSTPDGKPFGVGTNIYTNTILLKMQAP